LISRFLRGGDVLGFFDDLAIDHPRVAHLRLLGEHLYVLNHPDLILEVMHVHGRDTMKGRGLQGAKAVLGNGLLTSEGEVHLRQRRLVQPAFHRDRIAGYARDMVAAASTRSDQWIPGARIDMSDDMASLTFEIVGRTLFGADLRGDAADVGGALDTVLGGLGQRLILGPAVLRIPSRARSAALSASAELDAVVQRLIDDHRRSGDDSDMLGMLIASAEDGEQMTDAQVRDEAMTLVLAGHETTAMALSWAWLLLAQHPRERAWMEEELDGVLADRDPTMEDYPHLTRTRAVIAETLRLYPPAWIMGRRLLTDVTLDEWRVPAGAITLASPWVMHRDTRWWDQARQFRPARWLDAEGNFDESAPGQPRGVWFPFGWGNRRCIGEAFAWLEATLVLATLTRSWHAELVGGEGIMPIPGVTLRPEPGIPMTLHRR
jgi:cytochrome P450